MQRGAAEEDTTMLQNVTDIPTVQLKQMIRKAEHEIMVTGGTPYGQRYKATVQEGLDQLCRELGTREEC